MCVHTCRLISFPSGICKKHVEATQRPQQAPSTFCSVYPCGEHNTFISVGAHTSKITRPALYKCNTEIRHTMGHGLQVVLLQERRCFLMRPPSTTHSHCVHTSAINISPAYTYNRKQNQKKKIAPFVYMLLKITLPIIFVL